VSFWRRNWPAMIPAAVVTLLLGGLWLWARFLYTAAPDADLRALRVGAFVGWLGLLLLATTVAAIIWTAVAKPASPFDGELRQVMLGFSMLGDMAGLLILAVGLSDGFLTFVEVVRLYLLLVAWTGLWTAVAYVLKRWGAGVSIGVSLILATILMAGPVTLMPLVQAAAWEESSTAQASEGAPAMAAKESSAWQEGMVKGIGIACPLLGALDAARPHLEVHWAQLPGADAVPGLGQSLPVALPKWWVNTLVYAGAWLIICIGMWVFRSERSAGE